MTNKIIYSARSNKKKKSFQKETCAYNVKLDFVTVISNRNFNY